MNDMPTPPLVLLDTGGRRPEGPPMGSEPWTFESVDALIGWIEAIDVREGNLEVFDAEGRPIELSADSDTGPISWTMRHERYPAELEERLSDFVRRRGPQRWGLIDADLALDALLRALWRSEHTGMPFPRDIPER